MNAAIEQLLLILRYAWRRRWACLKVAAGVAAVGMLVVVLLPSRYESSARVYADTDGMLGPLLKGITVDSDVTRQLDIMQRTLLSRPNLERVLDTGGLVAPGAEPLRRQSALEDLQKTIKITSQGWNLFTVVYRDADPVTAQKVVQALLDIFVERNLGIGRADVATARKFIDEQIAVQGRALDEAERRLADFQKGHADVQLGEQGYFPRLQEARRQLIESQSNLDSSTAQRDEMRRQLATVPTTVSGARVAVGLSPVAAAEASDLSTQRRRLAELRSRYTEQHPDVLAQAEAVAALERRGGDRPSSGANIVTNPVYEQLRVQLAQKEAEIASFSNRLRSAQLVVADLSAKALTVPEAEADFKRLNRDYEVIKRNYDELLTRRESARIADDLDVQTDRISFRIVDPPNLPLQPGTPPRVLLMVAVLLAALGGAAAYAAMRALIEEPFESARRLQASYPFRVIGSLGEVITPAAAAAARRDRLRFAAAALALILVFGLVAVGERMRLFDPVRELIDRGNIVAGAT